MEKIKITEGLSFQEWSPAEEEKSGLWFFLPEQNKGPFVWAEIKNGEILAYDEDDVEKK